MAVPALEVVVVHHRTPTLLARTLESLAAHRPDAPVLVVDTALDPSLPQQLDGAHPSLRWCPAANHSYAHAVNVGLKRTRAPLIAVMNADVEVRARTLLDLIAPFEDASVALTGPLARTPEGGLQDQGIPYRWHVARLRWASRRAQSTAPAAPVAAVSVPWLSGCLMVVRRDAVARFGGMDGALRFFNEDVEWAQRFRDGGDRCVLVATEVLHVGGAATPPDGRFLVEGLRGGYALTRRHRPRWLRAAHRWGVAGYAALAGLAARDPDHRATWAEVRRRFVHADLDAAPFGPTLDAPLTPAVRSPNAPAAR
ncbi:MAG: glycosyltransferase family 2 protein [Trueperaceae bacterium]